jgi:hypothetical protein
MLENTLTQEMNLTIIVFVCLFLYLLGKLIRPTELQPDNVKFVECKHSHRFHLCNCEFTSIIGSYV